MKRSLLDWHCFWRFLTIPPETHKVLASNSELLSMIKVIVFLAVDPSINFTFVFLCITCVFHCSISQCLPILMFFLMASIFASTTPGTLCLFVVSVHAMSAVTGFGPIWTWSLFS